MNRYLQLVRSGFLVGFGISAAILLCIGVYASYATLTASTGESLTIGKWNELLTYTVPPGAIMAFSGTSCPTNWSEYTPARGRFLRGIDNGALNDPDGTRAPGAIQGDDFKSHGHSATDYGTPITIYDVDGNTGGNYGTIARSDARHTAGMPFTIGNTGGTETRPKNVAVLFCIKS